VPKPNKKKAWAIDGWLWDTSCNFSFPVPQLILVQRQQKKGITSRWRCSRQQNHFLSFLAAITVSGLPEIEKIHIREPSLDGKIRPDKRREDKSGHT
jgi:hypothetical protein